MKRVRWIGSSLSDLQSQRNVGYALHFAQRGDKHPTAKPLKGFSGAGVLEIVEDHDGETYRAVCTRFALRKPFTSFTSSRRNQSTLRRVKN